MNVGKNSLEIPGSNKKPIEKRHSTIMAKGKRNKEETLFYKTLHIKTKDHTSMTCEWPFSSASW
jgi:hypothetical protein